MLKIGVINPNLFLNIFPVLTNVVVLTEKQMEHIIERHPQDYERYGEFIPQILFEPDYILKDNKPNTVILLKNISENNKHFQLILRMKAAIDPEEYKNSILTFMKIDKSRYQNYVRNKKIIYRAV